MRRNDLIRASLLAQGEYSKTLTYLKEGSSKLDYQGLAKLLVIGDDDYPDCFYKLACPPLVLYYYGDISFLKKTCIGVVGSRLACDYALKATQRLVDEKKRENVIVSGLAKGVDAAAHHTALDNKTIAILGSGIDRIYPLCNKYLYEKIKKDHLVISEYPGLCKPFAYHFPWRNRLIAALSQNLYVMQASLKSGTLTTVNYALELDHSVYALPYDAFSKEGEGTNLLIQEGAELITF